MVAHFHRHRRRERIDPLRRRREFAVSGAHREIAGDRHRIGALFGDLLLDPIERTIVLEPEVNVREMEDTAEFRSHARSLADRQGIQPL